ncbi:hypothetical protein KQX54_008155 [Cotesia glomerata]|uniref:Uncharacterized protein n=1 Tax=Cotesia glomerata TaxID=32391 RepID=A0AAV7I506_COTGL|nr:hypothetical protein KQX54_008155 [Cotesia glomerata]
MNFYDFKFLLTAIVKQQNAEDWNGDINHQSWEEVVEECLLPLRSSNANFTKLGTASNVGQSVSLRRRSGLAGEGEEGDAEEEEEDEAASVLTCDVSEEIMCEKRAGRKGSMVRNENQETRRWRDEGRRGRNEKECNKLAVRLFSTCIKTSSGDGRLESIARHLLPLAVLFQCSWVEP